MIVRGQWRRFPSILLPLAMAMAVVAVAVTDHNFHELDNLGAAYGTRGVAPTPRKQAVGVEGVAAGKAHPVLGRLFVVQAYDALVVHYLTT